MSAAAAHRQLDEIRARVVSSHAWTFYVANWAAVLLFCDICLNVIYFLHGPLHPIDYPTYLEQAARITRDGAYDYAEIRSVLRQAR